MSTGIFVPIVDVQRRADKFGGAAKAVFQWPLYFTIEDADRSVILLFLTGRRQTLISWQRSFTAIVDFDLAVVILGSAISVG